MTPWWLLGPIVYQLAPVSLSASLLNAYEAVHDYMGVAIYLHWLNRSKPPTNLSGEYINEFSNQWLEFGLKLWGSFEGDLRHRLFRGLFRTFNWVYIERVVFPINAIIVFNRIEDILLLNQFIVREYPVWKGFPTLPQSIRYWRGTYDWSKTIDFVAI